MLLLTTMALAGPSVVATTVDEGGLTKRLSDEPADLLLLYAAEQHGSMETCGCPKNPRGSIARLMAYRDAAARGDAPVVLVNAGNWLKDSIGDDNRLREDARVANRHMVAAVEAGGWSALNVSFRDLPYLAESGSMPEGAVLANAEGAGIAPFVVVEAGDHTVAITGVTRWSKKYLQPDEVDLRDPVEALQSRVPEMREAADLVVVLGYALGREAKAVAELDIDVLVDADTHRSRLDPVVVGDTVWVRPMYETQRLGELRIRVGDDGRISSVHDRAIDLDKRIPSPAPWKSRAKRARAEIEEVSATLFP